MDDAISSSGGGDDGFFSVFKSALGGIAEGLGTTAREVVPRFFANELLDQQTNQLLRPTYLQTPGSPYNSQYGNAGMFGQQYDSYGRPVGSVQNAGLLFDNVNVNATGIIVVAVAAVAVILLLKS